MRFPAFACGQKGQQPFLTINVATFGAGVGRFNGDDAFPRLAIDPLEQPGQHRSIPLHRQRHPDIGRADTQPLRQDVRRAFPFAGILFEEYRGTVTLSTGVAERLIPAGEGIAFPIGTIDTFTTYGGPANQISLANTIGLPLYARQLIDEKDRWINILTEASILPVNKRPRTAIRLFSSH